MAELRFVLLIWATKNKDGRDMEQCPECGETGADPILHSGNLATLLSNTEYPCSREEMETVARWAKNAIAGDMLTCSDGNIAIVMSGTEAIIRDETPPEPKKNFVFSYLKEAERVSKKGKPKTPNDNLKNHPFCKAHPELHDSVWVEGLGLCEVVKVLLSSKTCWLKDKDQEIHTHIPLSYLRLP